MSPGKEMTGASIFPFFRTVWNAACFDRIVADIGEDPKILHETIYNAREETFTPDVPMNAIDLIVSHGENTHDPSHYVRKAFSLCRHDEEMKVISHNAEIFYLERVPLFRTTDDFEEFFLDRLGLELWLLSIDSTCDMIAGAFPQLAWMSHMISLRKE